jgi:hypothetical protein|tara:strand:+ start:155 stop:847 length:693 start_codon:yes stop_codon:yes gene_type:complete
MNSLFENWRAFISEEVEEPVTTLRIFDFDETIAHTMGAVRVKAPDGSTATLSGQKEFEQYMTQAAEKEGVKSYDPVDDLRKLNYKIDLSDFSIVKDPEEIKVVTNIMKQFSDDSRTYVMTARRGNSLGPILDYIQQIGIDSSQVRPIATEGESKGDVMVAMMRNKIMSDGKSNIRRIEYYEDSQRNIDDVLSKICDNPAINDIKPSDFELVIYKVVKQSEDIYALQEIRC